MERLWYFNDNYHVYPHGENGILFLAELAVLLHMRYNAMPISKGDMNRAIDAAIRDNKPFSHDNAVAVYALNHLYGEKQEFFIAEWYRRLHPRDIFFNLAVCYKPLWYLFMPFNVFFLLLTIFKNSYKNIDGDQILATDGKLLAFVKLNTYNLPFTKKLCDDRILKKHGGWHKIFEIYFKDRREEHPCVQLAREIYE